ncbi:MAG: divalent-cation tolerance protein CutA [Longimicrobiales bacterium]
MTHADVRLCFTTAPDTEVAERLVRALVDDRLVACGNILPACRSIYRWEGRVETAMEAVVILKTTAAAVPALVGRVRELHPYDVPEVLALPVTGGLGTYLDWVGDSVRSGTGNSRE